MLLPGVPALPGIVEITVKWPSGLGWKLPICGCGLEPKSSIPFIGISLPKRIALAQIIFRSKWTKNKTLIVPQEQNRLHAVLVVAVGTVEHEPARVFD